MNPDVIREYLVSLGFKVDSSSLGQAKQALTETDKAFKSFSGGVKGSMLAAGTAVVGFFLGSTAAIAGFVENLASSDLQMQQYAKRMNMTTDSARDMTNALDVLGVKLEDLYLSPELAERFSRLRKESASMRPPAGFTEAMREVRDVQFQFTRLRNTIASAGQWIGYYLTTYLDKPLKAANGTLSNWNEALQGSMPNWTRQIAQVLSWFVRLGTSILRGGQDVRTFLHDLPGEVKTVLVALAGLGLLASANPFMLMVIGITGLIVLLEDFYTYLDGGESLFGDLWSWLQESGQRFTDFWDDLDGLEKMGVISDGLISLGTHLGDAVQGIGRFFAVLSENEIAITIFKALLDGLLKTLEAIVGIVDQISMGIDNAFGGLSDLVSGDKNIGEVLGDWGKQLSSTRDAGAQWLRELFGGEAEAMKTVFNDNGGSRKIVAGGNVKTEENGGGRKFSAPVAKDELNKEPKVDNHGRVLIPRLASEPKERAIEPQIDPVRSEEIRDRSFERNTCSEPREENRGRLIIPSLSSETSDKGHRAAITGTRNETADQSSGRSLDPAMAMMMNQMSQSIVGVTQSAPMLSSSEVYTQNSGNTSHSGNTTVYVNSPDPYAVATQVSRISERNQQTVQRRIRQTTGGVR